MVYGNGSFIVPNGLKQAHSKRMNSNKKQKNQIKATHIRRNMDIHLCIQGTQWHALESEALGQSYSMALLVAAHKAALLRW